METRQISAVEYLLRFLFPPRCICCDTILELKAAQALCADCRGKMPVFPAGHISNPVGDNIGQIICAFHYEEGIRKAVQDLKFHDKPGNAAVLVDLAIPLIRRYLFTQNVPCPDRALSHNAEDSFCHAEAPCPPTNYDLLIPVPIHFKRRQQRGYNQSELLAKRLSTIMHVPAANKILLKGVNTPPQSSLGRGERLKNLKGAFVVKQVEYIKGKRILLVDDVMTTGTTLEQCAKTLKEAGAMKVDAYIVAMRKKM